MPRTTDAPATAICALDTCSDEPRRVAVVHQVPIWFRAWDAEARSWRERRTVRDWYFCSGACFEAWCSQIRHAIATKATAR